MLHNPSRYLQPRTAPKFVFVTLIMLLVVTSSFKQRALADENASVYYAIPARLAQSGETAVVNTTDDSNDGACEAAPNGDCTLREAINAANILAGADTITFDLTYPATITLTSTLPIVTSDITITGPGASSLTISGNNAARVFAISSGGTLTLDGLTVTEGSADKGGGIYNDGSLTITGGAVVSNNRATSAGGGIYNGQNGTLLIQDSTTISYNESNGSGGGIFNDYGSVIIQDNVSFNNNRSMSGGGGISNQGSLTVRNHVTISNNFTYHYGGGIFSNSNQTLIIQNGVLFSDNITGDGMGGAVSHFGDIATVSGSTFYYNDAFQGGAIFNAGNLMTVTNSTVSGNRALRYEGGGIYNSGTLIVTNSTFSGNSARAGESIYSFAVPATLRNTIVTGSDPTNICAGLAETLIDGGYNLEYPGDSCGFTDHAVHADPLLSPLQDNGGPTLTHVTAFGSPAIDAGDNVVCAASPVNHLDQRGVTRPFDGDDNGAAICDIGAVEHSFTDPFETDYDGLNDDWERYWFGGDISAYNAIDDPDHDGCNNGCEETRGTNPLNVDTDGDGLNDGQEVYVYDTEPLRWDTDDDSLNDYDELKVWNTDPWDEDSDDDKLKDGMDLPSGDGNVWVTYPLDPDSDDDGILDGDEVEAGTNPNDVDTDDDGLSDYVELVIYHTNPLDPDSDQDGLSDKREVAPSILTDPWDVDTDDDGLYDGDDLPEANPDDDTNDWNTNPHLADSDADSLTPTEGVGLMLDGQEAMGCTRPDVADTDGDMLSDGQELYIYHTNPCPGWQDTDGDGATDGQEVNFYHTDPLVPNPPGDFEDITDSDYDGLLDSWEMQYFGNLIQTSMGDPDGEGCNNNCEQIHGTNPTDPDTDHDRLTDYQEIYKVYPTDSLNPDTDDDRLLDGDEVLTYMTRPDDNDTDDDGLDDYEEVMTYKTDALKMDSDSDGLSDYDEAKIYTTNPLKVDTDSDGLTDYEDIMLYQTDPLKPDTDDDMLTDGAEVKTYLTDPLKKDTDEDGLDDGDEVNIYLTDPTKADTDLDTLSDYAEVMTHQTDPTQADTDADGLTDGAEINPYNTDPLIADTDGDGVTDGTEISLNIDPNNADTDSDELEDGEEIQHQCNPLATDTDGDSLTDYDEVFFYATVCSIPEAILTHLPTLLEPLTSTASARPTFRWEAVPDAASYELQLGRSSLEGAPIIAVTGNTYQPPTPLLTTSYLWQVRGVAVNGLRSPWSSPGTVVITSPTTAAPTRNLFETKTVPLQWGSVTWAADYQVQIAWDAGFMSTLINTNVGSSKPEYLFTAPSDGTYYWRVKALRANYTSGGWSAVGSFVVEQ